MLNKTLYFVIGAAVGAVASYFITKKVISDRERDRADKKIDEIVEMYRSKYVQVSTKADEVAKRNEERKEELLNDIKQSEKPEKAKADYNVVTHDDFVENLKIINEAGYTRYGANKPPHHVISYEEYNDPKYEDYYKGIEYVYYKGDGTVLDELGEEMDIHEIEDSVGTDFMIYFRDHKDETECYVRNDNRRIDYTVQCEDGYYGNTYDPDTEGEE